jgi:hypothetical protein
VSSNANEFAIRPELPGPSPVVRRYWTCPKTGLVVPKNVDENIIWRRDLLRMAEDDEGMQRELYTACKLSPLFFINAFVWTRRIFESNSEEAGQKRQVAHTFIPYVTWEIQDEHIEWLYDHVKKGIDGLTDKSRDMGATWDHIAMLSHYFLFENDRQIGVMSRVQEDVDDVNNPKCLLVKFDDVFGRGRLGPTGSPGLPEWMLPRMHRVAMSTSNLDNGSRIDGSSSNEFAWTGDRRHVLMLDEFAKMHNAGTIRTSTADVTPCRLVNSTPVAGREYSKWRNSGRIDVFTLPWWDHPEKGVERYVAQEESSGKWKIRSPWYDAECERRDPKEVAQELDMDHIGSGDTFFTSHVLEEHKRLFGRPPLSTRTIDFARMTPADLIPDLILRRDRKKLSLTPNGPLKLWVETVNGRLDQSYTYTIGIDASKGQGASNSTMSILCDQTNEKVAEWADANTPPYDFARIICAVSLWVGSRGRRLPFLVWEANGPGWDVGNLLVNNYRYPFYYRDVSVGLVTEKEGKRYGWHSSREKKEIALGHLRNAYAVGTFINHSEPAIEETLTYIYYDSTVGGGIGPADMMEESENARKTHGDRTIADMLTLYGPSRAPKDRAPKPDIPERSIGYRMQQWKREKKQKKSKNYFDFRR